MTGVVARVVAFFVAPGAAAKAEAGPVPVVDATASASPPCAAVVGSGERPVVPVAAAVAGELRLRAGVPAALVAVWRPDTPARTPVGAATPGARRLAARLAGEQPAAATACGRLAWLPLPAEPVEAAHAAAGLAARTGAPVVLALCGPRTPALEPLLAAQDLAVAVLRADADHDLRALALAALPVPEPARAIHAPLAPGPPRWAALAGLARLRSLPGTGREEGSS
jgi:hypothetical protein